MYFEYSVDFYFVQKTLLILVVDLRHDIIIQITKEQKQH